jgi:hypothetical protein
VTVGVPSAQLAGGMPYLSDAKEYKRSSRTLSFADRLFLNADQAIESKCFENETH